jgi:hypothetical protein
MIYESRKEPLLPRHVFLRRLRRHGLWALGILLFSLAVGMAGFHWLCGEAWIDAFLNAAMLLGGMGPIGEFHGTAGKIFAGLYALYAGVGFLIGAALVLAPVLHRVMHRWHIKE